MPNTESIPRLKHIAKKITDQKFEPFSRPKNAGKATKIRSGPDFERSSIGMFFTYETCPRKTKMVRDAKSEVKLLIIGIPKLEGNSFCLGPLHEP